MQKKPQKDNNLSPALFVTSAQLSGNEDFAILRLFDAISNNSDDSQDKEKIGDEQILLIKAVLPKQVILALYEGLGELLKNTKNTI